MPDGGVVDYLGRDAELPELLRGLESLQGRLCLGYKHPEALGARRLPQQGHHHPRVGMYHDQHAVADKVGCHVGDAVTEEVGIVHKEVSALQKALPDRRKLLHSNNKGGGGKKSSVMFSIIIPSGLTASTTSFPILDTNRANNSQPAMTETLPSVAFMRARVAALSSLLISVMVVARLEVQIKDSRDLIAAIGVEVDGHVCRVALYSWTMSYILAK